jgi:hypothetical protein
MKRVLVSILILLCTVSLAFASPKKKKKAPPAEKKPEITIDEESCSNKGIDYRQLWFTNPYDTAGKCYLINEIPLVSIQLLSRTVTLAGYGFVSNDSTKVAYLIDYGDESVPVTPFKGLFMGLGAFEYKTVSGSINTIPHLKKMKDYFKSNKPKQEVKEQPTKEQASEINTPKGGE